jgi:omega-hydroxy-beta-dihydromenaquinone-9 sulfotransferase
MSANRRLNISSQVPSQSGKISDSYGFAVWAAAILAIILLDYLLFPYLNFDSRFVDERGQGRVIFLLIAATLAVRAMSQGHRPLSYFGLAIKNDWQRSFMTALLIGASVPASVYFGSYLLGAHGAGPSISPYKYFSAGLAAIVIGTTAIYLQEIIYRGFIGTVFYTRLGAWGVVAGAFVFAVTAHFDISVWRESSFVLHTAFAMFLGGVILHLARIYHGNLVFPIGLACGWLYVAIFVERTKLVTGPSQNEDLLALVAPGGDIRNSPIIWLIFAAAILIYLVLIKRKSANNSGDQSTQFRTTQTKGIASTMFQGIALINPFSNMCLLAPLDVWLRCLWQARFMVHPVYWPRLCLILVLSAGSTIINLPERLLLPFFLRGQRHADPVVIIGAHRSGTTFLHEIMALDPRFVTPRSNQVFNATGFVLIGRLFYFFVGALLPWRRPMDSVEFSMHTPNEDEYGIALSSICSPYWHFTFPREIEFYDRFIYPDRMSAGERREWKCALSIFLKKVMLFKLGVPLLKSPYHTSRMELLLELYPDAKFVHIHRNPFDVYHSSMHFQKSFTPLFQLQFPESGRGFGDRLLESNFVDMDDRFLEDAAKLPDGRVAKVKYEDFTANTIQEVKRIYDEIGLEFTDEYSKILDNYFALRVTYQRNKYDPFSAEQRQEIYRKLKPLFDRWNYSGND